MTKEKKEEKRFQNKVDKKIIAVLKEKKLQQKLTNEIIYKNGKANH